MLFLFQWLHITLSYSYSHSISEMLSFYAISWIEDSHTYTRLLAKNEKLLRQKSMKIDAKHTSTARAHIVASLNMRRSIYKQTPYHHYCCYWKCIRGMRTSVTNGIWIRLCKSVWILNTTHHVHSSFKSPSTEKARRSICETSVRIIECLFLILIFAEYFPINFIFLVECDCVDSKRQPKKPASKEEASIRTSKHEWLSENFLSPQLTFNKWSYKPRVNFEKCSISKFSESFRIVQMFQNEELNAVHSKFMAKRTWSPTNRIWFFPPPFSQRSNQLNRFIFGWMRHRNLFFFCCVLSMRYMFIQLKKLIACLYARS